MKKFRIFADFDKEERFLNTTAGKGFRLVRHNTASLWYVFTPAEPAKLNYRVDFRQFKNKREYHDYLALFDESGWEHICGSYRSGSHYFLPAEGGARTEDIFSDADSKAGRFKRYAMNCITIFFVILMYIFILQDSLKTVGWSFLEPRSWYFTPGIWEKTSVDFWRAFLFETPFAIMRSGLPFIVLIALMFINGALTVKTLLLYKGNKQKRL
ncbi:MAG: DUF2812 domain-containing protein [Clostridiales bacterium]|jgi:uncharacterized integral membrane protein|nr:DUF2812 domain-containing protein [Clostridiales bacterium]